jgi:NAD(P)-dependent dehydrogenase (short-subunit alcohol dehydrogenase family)
MSRFEGVCGAITGGADGIGLGLRHADAARAAAEALRGEGIDAIGIGCDVTDRSSIEAAAADVVKALGSVGLLWANAGVGVQGHLSTVPAKHIDWVYAVNVKGMIDTVQVFWPLLLAATGERHVGFTGSSNTLGHIPDTPLGVYAASKWASIGVAESVSAQAKGLGMGATIFCPGLLDTRIWDGGRARPEQFGGPVYQPEEAGEFWRTRGMSVEWACEAAVTAAENDTLYCCPVDQHSLDDFEARMVNVRKGFVIHPAKG